MLSPYQLALALPLFNAICHVSAMHLEVRGELVPSHLTTRDHASGLKNAGNLNYQVNLTLGGEPVQVAIDTGR